MAEPKMSMEACIGLAGLDLDVRPMLCGTWPSRMAESSSGFLCWPTGPSHWQKTRASSDTEELFASDFRASLNGLLDGSFRSRLAAPITGLDYCVRQIGCRAISGSNGSMIGTLLPNEEWNRKPRLRTCLSVATIAEGTRFIRRKPRDGNSLKGESSKQNTPYNTGGRDRLRYS